MRQEAGTSAFAKGTHMKKCKPKIAVPPGKRLIFRPWITVGGKVITAASRGRRVFPILIDE